ncbi:bifunctional diaminohydroxyphosphoribosylaminopyrimidine deaminase/5-amino-6-(5-phosphoribosylamino)uracil reductase RibD [Stella humosa]|uniref:bifunctional diaminohydroxyphosphoribosylaminopyrimidine deaminase/5-amino-6-(5-phosphoribosylamino)uracil reductase RibD n=1 Tax=Stella humosa TaxID=94 RepID=UPI0030B8191B
MTQTRAPDPGSDDVRHMRAALALADRNLGRVWPNPSAGCVIVRAGRVVGRGWTQPGGRPHAEVEALGRAGAAARGATVYVSLEPCCHWGRTPPCTDALTAAGVARVVYAVDDPDPRVSGKGAERLRAAGIDVRSGVLAAEAEALNEGFFRRMQDGRPLVTLKVATSLDGRIAAHTGASRWITGAPARAHGHLLRARHDGVMVGIGTALADEPQLTCRLAGLEDRHPVRIVVDSRLRLPLTARLVQEAAEAPVWLLTLPDADPARRHAFEDCGVTVISVSPRETGTLDMAAAMAALAGRGLTRVLVEGGGRLAATLLRDDLVDHLEWFRAPTIIGGDGVPAAVAFGIVRPDDAPRFERVAVRELGVDILERYRRLRHERV